MSLLRSCAVWITYRKIAYFYQICATNCIISCIIVYVIRHSVSDNSPSSSSLGEGGEMGYGRQRVWGTIGFGIAAFLAGYTIDLWSQGDIYKTYTPAFLLVFAFTCFDLICCKKLEASHAMRTKSKEYKTERNFLLTLTPSVVYSPCSCRLFQDRPTY